MWDSNTIRTCSSWTSNSFSSTGMTCVWNKAGDRRQLVWLSPVCSGEERWRREKAASIRRDSSPKSYSLRNHHSWDLQCHPNARSDSLSAANTACLGCQRGEGGEAAVPVSIARWQRLWTQKVKQSQVLLGWNTSSYLGKTKGRKRVGTEIARDPARHAEHPLRGKGEETEHPYRRMRAVTEEKMSGRVGERWEEGYAVSHGESLGWAGGVTRKSGKEPEQFLILFPTSAEQREYCTRGGTHNCPFQFCMLQYLFWLNKYHYSLDSMERRLWIHSKLVSNNSEEKVFKGHLSLDPADEEENSWQLQVLQIRADWVEEAPAVTLSAPLRSRPPCPAGICSRR